MLIVGVDWPISGMFAAMVGKTALVSICLGFYLPWFLFALVSI